MEQSIRASALLVLTGDQRKRLAAQARLKARGTSLEADDLLQGARERWLKSDVAVGGHETTFDFLWGAINSIAFNDRRRRTTVRRTDGERVVAVSADGLDPIETAPDPMASQEDGYLREQIFGLCEGDADLRTLLIYLDDGASRADILAELGGTSRNTKPSRKGRGSGVRACSRKGRYDRLRIEIYPFAKNY